MSDDASQIQCHVDPATSDTLNFGECIPIVFVPGIMGSRIAMPSAGRTWDPDVKPKMAMWIPPSDTVGIAAGAVVGGVTAGLGGAIGGALSGVGTEVSWRRANRKALSPRTASATVLTELSPAAKKDLDNDTICIGIAQAANSSDYYTMFGKTRGWAGIAWGFYGTILRLLERTFNTFGKHPVFACGYDWRSSNDDSGYHLNDFVANVLKQCPDARDVVIVTHSMGGIVTRAALHYNATLASKVRGVIHGAQPSNGAVVCFRRFFTGCQPGLDGGPAAGTAFTPDWVLNRIMGNRPSDYAYSLSGCPGALQLLPNQIYQQQLGAEDTPWLTAADGAPDCSDIFTVYESYKWPGLQGAADIAQNTYSSQEDLDGNALVNEFKANLQMAKEMHGAIATTVHPNTFVILSNTLATDNHVSFGHYPADASMWTAPNWSPDSSVTSDLTGMGNGVGDGTVPAISAMCPALILAAPPVPVPNLEHSQVYQDETFNQQAITFIKMLLSVPFGTFLTGPTACTSSSSTTGS